MVDLILGSKSASRRRLLTNAGYSFTVVPACVDEREIERRALNDGITVGDIALMLARAKGIEVSRRRGAPLTIAADQNLEINGEILHKPKSFDEAHDQLTRLSGRKHKLYSALALARDGQINWCHLEQARLTMRKLSDDDITRYLAKLGKCVFNSVGSYQIEGLGVHLFSAITGGFDTIIGLPLIPLINRLSHEGITAY